jgi:soluble lytic murein transglycosylase-like protein
MGPIEEEKNMDPRHALLPGFVAAIAVLVIFTWNWTAPLQGNAATESPADGKAQVTHAPVSEAASAASGDEASCTLSSRVIAGVRYWCAQIETVAVKYGLSPELVAAVMSQESGGQADIISGSGAVGLMQVMPSDGVAASFACVNGPCFARRPTTAELLDPDFNLDYGVRMLAGLLKKYGNLRDALMAYGPYNIGYAYADRVLAIQQAISG